MDDVHEITALKKLGIHACLSGWLVAILYVPVYSTVLGDLPLLPRMVATAAAVFVPLWLINLYNFIDGIDGMAIGGSVFLCSAALVVLAIGGRDGKEEIVLAFALLAACSVGFLFFNLPPASVFMGDAGSIFLGYTFAALLLTTVFTGQLALFTWITMLGYFIGDTTTTTVCRMFMVKRWYGVHKSHAYQNLARVLTSHAKVTYGVVLYHVCWVLPLVVWGSRNPARGYIAASLSVAPAVFWTLRYGPRYSSD
jgi:Fuc2NAc and GlcNAc transferase